MGRFMRSLKSHLGSDLGTYLHSKHYTLADLISVILREMKRRAEAHFGSAITSIVLGDRSFSCPLREARRHKTSWNKRLDKRDSSRSCFSLSLSPQHLLLKIPFLWERRREFSLAIWVAARQISL